MISVIVAIYNVEAYLEQCINSIINQTYTELEIILVDDGSTDLSGKICDVYAVRDLRIKVIHKENGGLVSARKAGVSAATGEYVGYVDGDDWIEPDLYERMMDYLIEYQVDMIETEHFMDAGEKSVRIMSKYSYGKYDAKELIPDMLCDKDFNECKICPYLWSKLFKKRMLYNKQMDVDETIQCGEDAAVTYPYILQAESIYIADYAGYHYVQRQDSMTSMQTLASPERDKAFVMYLKTVFERAGKNSGIMIKQLNRYTKSMILLRQISYFDRDSENKKLMPFGGVDLKCHIALYGAGRMGKSVYQYLWMLNRKKSVMWGDKEYLLYRQIGLPVISPDEIVARQKEFDMLLIAVSSRYVSDMIKGYLVEKGMKREKMLWLTEQFINDDNNILEPYTLT